MNVLVLGGTRFVGRALVEEALAAGHVVATLNRGVTGPTPSGARVIRVDRTDHEAFERALADSNWDAVVDTWAGAPVHASMAASILGPRTKHYAYVSSRSVYSWPLAVGADENHPLVDADSEDPTDDDYARSKRGGELGVLRARSDALIARAGLILGPWEDVGRLPWWLNRIRSGGRVLAPGPRDRKLQYIDARDLAQWMLKCAEERRGGAFNTVSESGHTTMGELLETAVEYVNRDAICDAELVWCTPEAIEKAGLGPWVELPIWLPPTGPLIGLHDADVSAAFGAGLRCRPIAETVSDTWRWIQAEGAPTPPPDRAVGLDPQREAAFLSSVH